MIVSTATQLSLGGLAGTELHAGSYDLMFHLAKDSSLIVEADGKTQKVKSDSSILVDATDGRIRVTLSPVNPKTSVCGVTLKKVS